MTILQTHRILDNRTNRQTDKEALCIFDGKEVQKQAQTINLQIRHLKLVSP
jgi:hypothetical protein